MRLEPKGKASRLVGVSWPSSMSPFVIKLLLGGLGESGHRRIPGLLWNVIITANQVVLVTGKECTVYGLVKIFSLLLNKGK